MITLKIRKSLLSGSGLMDLVVDLEIPKGQLLALSGPSGSGKTSLLRIIAGLLPPEEGRIAVDGQCWTDTTEKINWPTQKRNIGFVFHDYALFPHFTVRQNLQYALFKGQSKDHIHDLIAVMELQNLLDRKPATLSGGQQQRVALARALVRKPSLLLLDEPLSALDPSLRRRLQAYILQVHQDYRLTTILVSHDQKEIARMADRVLLIQEGKIVDSDRGQWPPKPVPAVSLRLTGRITALQQMADHYQVEVALPDRTIELTVPLNVGILQINEEIVLEAGHWQLHKL